MGIRLGPGSTPPQPDPSDQAAGLGALPEPSGRLEPDEPVSAAADRQAAPGDSDVIEVPPVVAAGLGFRRMDLIVLPLVFLLDILVFSSMLRSDTSSAGRIAIIGYSAIGIGLLAFRHRAPVVVFCAVLAHSLLALLTTAAYIPVLILLVALEAVAEVRPMRVSLTALAATIAPTALLVSAAAREASPDRQITAAIGSAIFYAALGMAAWVIGRVIRRHQSRLSRLQAMHEAEVERQRAAAEQAVSIERLRIARELHDIVAHSVTIMVLHAAGAKRVMDTDQHRAKESLTTIEQSGQQAMGELRRLLELLRENDGDGHRRPGSPLPGLAQLPQMVSSVRGSGIDVSLQVTGAPGRLDASIELAAYRLVQEALTNISKHRGAGACATVSIDWGTEKMTVAVENDGAGSPQLLTSLSTGNGLTGLRERIAIAGGDFAAGPTDSGGFRVAARLPVSGLPGTSVELPIQSVPPGQPDRVDQTAPGIVRVDP
jgi:signal transduction histidine kinase